MATQKTSGRTFTPNACERCGGDAFYDRLDEQWNCLQCGREVVFAAAVAEVAAPVMRRRAA
jgi:ribosomal protein L37AE/L43A